MFKHQKEDTNFISEYELSRDLCSTYIASCPILHKVENGCATKKCIVERRKKNLGINTTQSEPSAGMLMKYRL